MDLDQNVNRDGRTDETLYPHPNSVGRGDKKPC